jgi:hypothetical protein
MSWFVSEFGTHDMKPAEELRSIKFSREIGEGGKMQPNKKKYNAIHTPHDEILNQIFILRTCTDYWIIPFGFYSFLLFRSENIPVGHSL